MSGSKRALALAALFALAVPSVARAQFYIAPMKAEQSRVRYSEFDWMHIDILVDEKMATPRPAWTSSVTATSTRAGGLPDASALYGTRGDWGRRFDVEAKAATSSTAQVATVTSTRAQPDPRTATAEPALPPPVLKRRADRGRKGGDELPPGISKAGGMRLYFYRQEDTIASRAAGSIEATYLEYTKEFGYVPRDPFPYMLFSSYQEFLQTNLFPVREGILGVTSTRGDLKLALPFFGDYQLFREVSRHEMAHQFTIQKARQAAEDVEGRNGLEGLPLWLVEGLAEYYAKKGHDEEAELFALDLVLNANVERGWGMLGFFEDRPGSGLWTYKIGMVRCVFLEEVYGRGTIQRILDASPLLAGDVGARQRIRSFPQLVEALVGDEPQLVSAKFAAWIKRRMLPTYLRARQSPVDVEVLPGQPEFIDTINASPNGHLIAVRSLELETGQAELRVFDDRAPTEDRRVAIDGVPGSESLHPFAGRNFALSNDAIVYVAESGGADVLYRVEIEHRAARADILPEAPQGSDLARHQPAWRLPGLKRTDVYDVKISLGERTTWALGPRGILAAYAPAFSPDGKKVAFIGLDTRGQRDLWVLTPKGGDDFELARITNDENAERTLAWSAKDGLVFTSDHTAHGFHNLFHVRPEPGAPIIALVDERREHYSPTVTADGRIFYTAFDDARSNAYEITDQGVVQRTDFASGLFDVSPGPDGSVWGLFHHGGERRVVKVKKEKLLTVDRDERWAKGDGGEAQARPRLALDNAVPYRPLSLDNWHLDGLFAFAGYSGSGLWGQIFAATSDRMQDHAVILQLFAYGSLDLTDAKLYYVNQEGRYLWGAGPFQTLSLRYDPTFVSSSDVSLRNLVSYERYFGGMGVVRYPFNQFFYVQGELSAGGAAYALDKSSREALRLYGKPLDIKFPLGDPRGDDKCLNAQHCWDELNSGVRFQTRASLTLGYSTLRYHRATGPLDGTSMLLDASLSVQPFDDDTYANLHLDLERYFQLIGRVNFFIRGGTGTSIGGKQARRAMLYSFDTIRGAQFGDQDFLLGRTYMFSTAELQFPLNFILAFALLTDIEGIVGVDFGGANDELDKLFDRRVLDFVWGFNFGIGPLVLRLHFAKPIDTGVPVPNNGDWVTNFSLGWIGM